MDNVGTSALVEKFNPLKYKKEVTEIIQKSNDFLERIVTIDRIPVTAQGYMAQKTAYNATATVISEMTSIPFSWNAERAEQFITTFTIGSNFALTEKALNTLEESRFMKMVETHVASIMKFKEDVTMRALLSGAGVMVVGSGDVDPLSGKVDIRFEDIRAAYNTITEANKDYMPAIVIVNPIEANIIRAWDFFTDYSKSGEVGGFRKAAIGNILSMEVIESTSMPSGKVIVLAKDRVGMSPAVLIQQGSDINMRPIESPQIRAFTYPMYTDIAAYVRDGDALCVIDLYDSAAYTKLISPTETPYLQSTIDTII